MEKIDESKIRGSTSSFWKQNTIYLTVEDISGVGQHVGRNDDTSDLTGAVVVNVSENDGYAS
ncbi:hypothetical protein [Edaphobacter modestus]|uniref:hypothetical protein n=1 Tax=Edaphobacter modestus TaxID=388466 RepID=UPI0013EEE2A4|nr:hypothetical protein [Edaphobacter modestus]